jgi:hypothetical protein
MIYLFTINHVSGYEHVFYYEGKVFMHDENNRTYTQLFFTSNSFHNASTKMFSYSLPEQLNMHKITDNILDCIEIYVDKVIFNNI